jgi:hypothetical protein
MSAILSQQQREELKRRMNQRIEQLFQSLDKGGTVRNAQQLQEVEKEIVSITDGMAGEAIKTIVEHALQDQEPIDKGRALTKESTMRMKNHGKREVEIQPYRGDPFPVETTYYCKAGQSPKKGKKKKGSTQN